MTASYHKLASYRDQTKCIMRAIASYGDLTKGIIAQYNDHASYRIRPGASCVPSHDTRIRPRRSSHNAMTLHHTGIRPGASCVLCIIQGSDRAPVARAMGQEERGRGSTQLTSAAGGQEVVKGSCRGRSMSGGAYYITAACPGTVVTNYAFACLHNDCNSRSWRNCSAHRARQKARGLRDALGGVVTIMERFWYTRNAPVWDLVCEDVSVHS